MDKQVKFITKKTVAVLGEDGFWTVIADLVAGEKEGDEPFDTRTIACKAIGKDLEGAVKTAYKGLDAQFADLDHNLFNLPKEKDGKYFPYPLKDNETS